MKHGITKDAFIALQILAAITIFTNFWCMLPTVVAWSSSGEGGRSLLSTIALLLLLSQQTGRDVGNLLPLEFDGIFVILNQQPKLV